MSDSTVAPQAPTSDLAERAIALAERWVAESAEVAVDPAAERLAGVLKDPNGLPFTLGFVDGVMRPESLTAAATNLQRVAPLAPAFLPWYLRAAVRAGGVVAPILPTPVVPIARRVLREMVGHLIVDARPDKLGPALQTLRESGARLNLNLLGEAVLGESEALRRLEGIHELVRRDDVDYVSVKVSAIASHLSMWAFDEIVERVVERLRPLYLSAAEDATFLNLDMEEYRDLDLTMAVFMRVLDDPRLRDLEAGIVLQAYLPDALPALQTLTAWARERVAAGGARIKIRLVKGANLAMEHVDAVMHDWPAAPYDTKLDTDANYVRCLDEALRPENTQAVRIGVAGHNLFHIAYAWLLAGERGVQRDLEVEMLLGMAQGQVQAVAREIGHVLLYVPVVRPDEFDVAISYLVRRLEENASSENFLSAAFDLAFDRAMFVRERDRFTASVVRATDRTLTTGPRRRQDRAATVDDAVPATVMDAASAELDDAALTQVVLGIAGKGSRPTDPDETQPGDVPGRPALFGGDAFVETAVFSSRETVVSTGAPGFRNTADTDPALPANRTWAREIFGRVTSSTAGDAAITAAHVGTESELEAALDRVGSAADAWGSMPAADRAGVLLRAAAALERRRGELIEVAASETGKALAEADVEVSEAVDFARYYAATARELDSVSGAVFVPARVTVVTPPWNFPVAIPAGGALAALAAGSGVVFKPAPQARRCAAVVAEAIWEALDAAGIGRDVLALVDLDEGGLGKQLITHPAVDRVILTGSFETAALFRSWRPDLALQAETSGKNAMIVMPSADLDLAASDLVRSAFGHAGQKCSAASLAILVGPVGRSQRFSRQLVDAATSLRVGAPEDPLTEVGPLVEAPTGKLEWALTTLDEDEAWLVEPRRLPHERYDGRLWSPGIRTGVKPGSRMHLEEFFGPVLGVMHARSLEHAIELQNAVDYGLTAGLYTQNPDDLALWLDRVEAGNLYVNRGTTGAIVQRQPFGGWKRSSVGAGAKAGGPNHLIGLGSWRPTSGAAASSTLHLRGLDSSIAEVIEAAQPALGYDAFEWLRRAALSDAVAWDRTFGKVVDVSHLEVERNLFRYRPASVEIRSTADAAPQALVRAIIAAVRARSTFVVSTPSGLPATVRQALGDLEVSVFVESDAQWIARMAGPSEDGAPTRADRVRLVGPPAQTRDVRAALVDAIAGDPDLAIYADEVTQAGRIELLPFLREQSITITAHRFGNPDHWSASVI
ncbi:proline dehydrogenase family protein [Microbacterium oleivorans]|uniref:L-glutamate gamma-semialdehyde dehydrogenase n=1 Tax=Microbacterium oleivorans TaxID=273677 RepID=A0A031FXI6_9MICO|nr:bifunctional proline dehydrogenase/L-glutamate gamma-semialdehyde dehydrogenase [Microbacterium oleivorans]EZP29283.1 Aldehyde Dehydrogenase [Microbacterium oleivorans]